MSLILTPAAAPDASPNTRNPLGRLKGLSKVVFDEAFTRRTSPFGSGRISVSRGGRMVVTRKDRSIGIWRVLPDEQGWNKVLEMDLRVRSILHIMNNED